MKNNYSLKHIRDYLRLVSDNFLEIHHHDTIRIDFLIDDFELSRLISLQNKSC